MEEEASNKKTKEIRHSLNPDGVKTKAIKWKKKPEITKPKKKSTIA